MIATVQPLRQKPHAARSPEREALRNAIEHHAEAEQRLAQVTQALDGSWSAINTAERAVKDAEAAIEQAKRDAAGHLAASMMGTAGAAPVTVKQARSNLQDAEDKRDAAQAAGATLERERKDAEQSLAIRRLTLNDAVRNVLRTSGVARKLLDDLATARRAVADLTAQLNALPGDAIEDQFWGMRDPPAPNAEALAAWTAALGALRSDADAELPKA